MPADSDRSPRNGSQPAFERFDIERQRGHRQERSSKTNLFSRLANRGYKKASTRHSVNGDDTTYVFESSDDDSIEVEFQPNSEHYRLKQRSQQKDSGKQQRLTEHLVYEIKPGDTLQNLSLRCGCTVSELKSSNNFINDQDFYGHRFIKIPVKKYGILSEVLTHQINTARTDLPDDCNNEHRKSPPLVVNLGMKQTFASEDSSDLKKFLTHLDHDLENIRNITLNYSNDFQLATNSSSEVLIAKNSHVSYCDEDNCGLTWTNVLVLALFVCILIPVIYLLIFEEQNSYEKETHLKDSQRSQPL